MRSHSAAGFTLIEVLVALLIGSVVVLGARALLDGLAAQTSRVARLAEQTDAEANGEQIMRSIVARTGLASDSAARFAGTAEEATFESWCDVPGGWQERCAVRLRVEPAHDSIGAAVTLDLGTAGRVHAMSAPHAATLRYLSSAANGGRWVDRWNPAIIPPLAIAVIAERVLHAGSDTMVLRVGEGR